jgi:hypothetical protein
VRRHHRLSRAARGRRPTRRARRLIRFRRVGASRAAGSPTLGLPRVRGDARREAPRLRRSRWIAR